MDESTTARSAPPRNSPPEPRRTIYGATWTAAQRALAVPPAVGREAEREALRDLAYRIDVGWVFVRPILLYAQDVGRQPDADPVFTFSVETAELFRDLAEIALGWIADPDAGTADPASMVTELERFATHVTVLEMASRGEQDPLAAALSHLAREVPAWCEGITAAVSALAESWDPHVEPADGEPPS